MDAKKTITYSVNLTPGLTTLFIVFLVLKLTHVIDWSWWWVTCPLWIGFAIIAVCIVFALVILLLVGVGIVLKEAFK